jgi:hypothetical protein
MQKTDNHIKYTVIERKDGMFQAQKEYGNKMLYPAFDTLRDLNIFMDAIESDYITGIVGNVQIVKQ